MYIVYVFPKNNRTARGIYDPAAERLQNDCVGECKRIQTDVHSEEDNGSMRGTAELGTFLFTGRHAEAMAKKAMERLAKTCPGDDVYLAAVSQVATTTFPEVVYKGVSEKGVLPL